MCSAMEDRIARRFDNYKMWLLVNIYLLFSWDVSVVVYVCVCMHVYLHCLCVFVCVCVCVCVCTVKNGALRYTLISVVEEVLFQHPCLASIFSRKIVVVCMLT